MCCFARCVNLKRKFCEEPKDKPVPTVTLYKRFHSLILWFSVCTSTRYWSHRSRNFAIVFPLFDSTSSAQSLNFSIAFHRSTSKPFFSLLFHSFTRHHFPLHSSLPSVFFTVFPPVLLNRPIVYAINLSFHFINFSSVLPWCYSISPSLPLYYLSVSNAYPNAPPTIPTVAPYKRFCSFLPWFYFRASTPQWSHIETAIFPLLFHCFTRALRDNGPTSEPQFFHCFSTPSISILLLLFYTWHHFPSVLLKFSILFPLFYVIFPHFFHCFSHHFPLHCNLPKSSSEGGPGGNRYPTVTQLPPGT